MKTRLGLSVLALVATLGAAAQAMSIPNGAYTLGSHPDGTENPPPYGLRLDGLLGDNSEEYTFNFSDASSAMSMTISDSVNFAGKKTVVISGTSFGGEDVGAVYNADLAGLWQIDFTYDNVMANGDMSELWTDDADAGNNTGKLTALFGSTGAEAGRLTAGDMFDLEDFAGSHDFSFKLKFGHRGFVGVSGFGWLNHRPSQANDQSPMDHIYASDWLFTAERIPPPPPVVPLPAAFPAGLACMGLIVARKRMKKN